MTRPDDPEATAQILDSYGVVGRRVRGKLLHFACTTEEEALMCGFFVREYQPDARDNCDRCGQPLVVPASDETLKPTEEDDDGR